MVTLALWGPEEVKWDPLTVHMGPLEGQCGSPMVNLGPWGLEEVKWGPLTDHMGPLESHLKPL